MILFFIACTSGEAPTPDTLIPLLRDPDAFHSELTKVQDPEYQDLLMLQVAIREPKYAEYLCKKVKTKNAKEKCRQIIGRPHLSE